MSGALPSKQQTRRGCGHKEWEAWGTDDQCHVCYQESYLAIIREYVEMSSMGDGSSDYKGGDDTPSPYTSTSHLSILEEAQVIVFGPRQGVYGHPRDDFQRTADLWTAYFKGRFPLSLDYKMEPQDVGALMILLKMARLMESPDHRDSIVDIAGYAETMARVRGIDA